MCQNCDDDVDFDLEDEDEIPLSAESARAFFMALLEEAEASALFRYNAAETRFHEIAAKVQEGYAEGNLDRSLLDASKAAFADVTEAKKDLTAGLQRTAYKMSHAALA